MRLRGLALCLGLALAAGPALADGLTGRTVLFRAATWDNPDAPDLVSSDYRGVVGDGPEFGMVNEVRGDLGVVPVLIDLSEDRIDFSYPGVAPGTFALAEFNGYILDFPAQCTVIAGAWLDVDATSPPLAAAALTVAPQSLRINLSGLDFDADSRISILLDVLDCPIS